MAAKTPPNLLMVADTDHNANMLYAVGMFIPDPFVYLRLQGRPFIVMSDLEIDRARKEASHCRVVSLSRCQKRLKQQGIEKPGIADVIRLLLSEKRLRRVMVPSEFPVGLADDLADRKISVESLRPGPFPEREFKRPDEIRKLTQALRMAEAGCAAGIEAVRDSRIAKNGNLKLGGVNLTSERLRAIVDGTVLNAGGTGCHTIVAGGSQACDPHESGHGPLKAHKPIIIDIFPRCNRTGYFGDLTRTVVRGKASDAVRNIYSAVWEAQETAFRRMRPGVPTREIHEAVQEHFKTAGYKTGKRRGRMEGFFHGTGHGLGLEIHEAPRMGAVSEGNLTPGQVITVEPGLYYPGIGGVRLEDVVVVTGKGIRNLTRIGKVLEV